MSIIKISQNLFACLKVFPLFQRTMKTQNTMFSNKQLFGIYSESRSQIATLSSKTKQEIQHYLSQDMIRPIKCGCM
jgi:hypothetical protein